MTTSASDNFTVNRDEIIDLAGLGAGIKGIGRVLSAEDTDIASKLLNLIVKQWMGNSDFAPGLKVWTRKRAFLFPELNEHQYTLGSSGDHATASYSQTTVSSDEAIGQTTLSVTSTTGMTANDYIGIICDDGSIHWSTIASTGAGPTVVINDALTVAASSGSTVYWYTTKISKPLTMLSVRRRDATSNETPLSSMSFSDYEMIGNKTNTGDPSRYLYERGITSGELFLDLEVSDTSDVYLLTYLRPVEDFDSANDTPDFPQEWERALVGQLAVDWATFAGKAVTQEMVAYRDQALSVAQNLGSDDSTADDFFQSET